MAEASPEEIDASLLHLVLDRVGAEVRQEVLGGLDADTLQTVLEGELQGRVLAWERSTGTEWGQTEPEASSGKEVTSEMYGIYGAQHHGEQRIAEASTDEKAVGQLPDLEAAGWTDLEVRPELWPCERDAEDAAARAAREQDYEPEPGW